MSDTPTDSAITAEAVAKARAEVARFLSFDAWCADRPSPTFEAMRVVMADYSRLTAELDRLKVERDAANEDALRLGGEIKELRDELVALTVERDRLAEEVADLKDDTGYNGMFECAKQWEQRALAAEARAAELEAALKDARVNIVVLAGSSVGSQNAIAAIDAALTAERDRLKPKADEWGRKEQAYHARGNMIGRLEAQLSDANVARAAAEAERDRLELKHVEATNAFVAENMRALAAEARAAELEAAATELCSKAYALDGYAHSLLVARHAVHRLRAALTPQQREASSGKEGER